MMRVDSQELFHTPSPPPDEPKPFSVLVMEDDLPTSHVMIRKIQNLFERLDCPCIIDHALDGWSGLELCRQRSYNCYVIDHNMPPKNEKVPQILGANVCELIIDHNPFANVVLFSALNDIEKAALKLPPRAVHINKQIGILVQHLEDLVVAFKAQRATRKCSADGDPQ